MHLADSISTSLAYVTSLLTLSPVKGPIAQDQALLLVSHDTPHQAELVGSQSATHAKDLKGPIFKPPSGSLHGDGSDFVCDYSNMIGYEQCSEADDRTCWLKNPTTHDVIDINTDYENTTLTPIGIHRKYTMYLDKGTVNADGIDFDDAKIFNDQYPGPWIQACWGDVSNG